MTTPTSELIWTVTTIDGAETEHRFPIPEAGPRRAELYEAATILLEELGKGPFVQISSGNSLYTYMTAHIVRVIFTTSRGAEDFLVEMEERHPMRFRPSRLLQAPVPP